MQLTVRRFWEERQQSGASAAWIDLSEDGNIGSVGRLAVRNAEMAAPYGFYSVPTEGEQSVLLPLEAERMLMIGVLSENRDLQKGEVELRAQSGAYIRLKQDGTVEINGFIIQRDGSIKEGG